jgi:hypothetical protein
MIFIHNLKLQIPSTKDDIEVSKLAVIFKTNDAKCCCKCASLILWESVHCHTSKYVDEYIQQYDRSFASDTS